MQDRIPAAGDDARRLRRARLRIYESLGVAAFMVVLLLALWIYVQSNSP